MLRKLVTATVLVYTVIFFVGCGGDSKRLEIKSGLAAKIGDQVIKEREVTARMKALPRSQKERLKGEIGKARLVDAMIKERVVYMAALEKKLQYEENIKTRLDYARRTILIGAYYSQLADEMKFSDKEIREYYGNNQLEFKERLMMKAQHIFSQDSLKVVGWKKRIDNSDKAGLFGKIAMEESEDATTAKDKGDLGYFHPDEFIKFVGKDEEFGNAVSWLEKGEISDVISYGKGYSLVKVTDKNMPKIKPISDVREIIIKKIKDVKIDGVIQKEERRLEEKYEAVNYVREELLKNTKSAQEIWELAQEETSPRRKIIYYRAISTGYPDHKFAAQALFMIAFVYAEEMDDFTFAKRALNELFEKYPDAEIIESAKWLKKNMRKETLGVDSVKGMGKE